MEWSKETKCKPGSIVLFCANSAFRQSSALDIFNILDVVGVKAHLHLDSIILFRYMKTLRQLNCNVQVVELRTYFIVTFIRTAVQGENDVGVSFSQASTGFSLAGVLQLKEDICPCAPWDFNRTLHLSQIAAQQRLASP